MLLDFIVIILIYLFVTYPVQFVLFSNTILGKLIAVCIIIHITRIDALYGLLACMGFLYYYQTDYVDGIQDINGQYIYELFTNMPSTDAPSTDAPSPNTQFKDDYCDMGKLKYKEYEIKHDMAHHVFPELKFHESSCNPSHHTCKYTIEQKLDVEDMLAPKMSNWTVWEELRQYIENIPAANSIWFAQTASSFGFIPMDANSDKNIS